MPTPVAQRGDQQQGLLTGKTATSSGAKLSSQHSLYEGILLKIPPDASLPLPKFPPSTPPIFIWHCNTPQNQLSAASPPRECTPIGMWLTLLPSLILPGITQTVIYPVQEIRHVRYPVPKCRKWRVLYEHLHLPC